MARTVLAETVRAWSVPVIAVLYTLGAGALLATQTLASERLGALVCNGDLSGASPELQNQYPSFKQRIETGPLYLALVQRGGSPRNCQHTVESGALRLSYTFPRSATLTAQIDPRIEFSEERADFHGLTNTEAKALLQRGEKHAFGKRGCGIAWQNPDTEESSTSRGVREEVYRGDVCNCQARIVYERGKISAVILRSAC